MHTCSERIESAGVKRRARLLTWATIVILQGNFGVTAGAVMLSADGTGQALVYPYYTVRDANLTQSAYNTIFSVVNQTDRGKAVKVRFYEAKAGVPVFDINVFLSARDVWTAGVVPLNGSTALLTQDASCIAPAIAAISPMPFDTTGYLGDGIDASPGRTREGYFEILEMGTVTAGSPLQTAITHTAGVPACNLPDDASIAASLLPPTGGLYGSATILSVFEGTAYGYDAVAFDGWRDAPLYTSKGAAAPALVDATPARSTILDHGRAYISDWQTGTDAATAVLMQAQVESEFMIEQAVAGGTDIVLTMPTRRSYVDLTTARPPFSAPLSATGPCEAVTEIPYNRDEQHISGYPGDIFGRPQTTEICFSSTVHSLRFQNGPTGVLGSLAPLRSGSVAYSQLDPYQNGVDLLVLSDANSPPQRKLTAIGTTTIVDLGTGVVTTRPAATYAGLPIVGASFVRYFNGSVPGQTGPALSSYGTGSTQKALRSIVLP